MTEQGLSQWEKMLHRCELNKCTFLDLSFCAIIMLQAVFQRFFVDSFYAQRNENVIITSRNRGILPLDY